MKQIVLKNGGIRKLSQSLNVSERTVYSALHYHTNSIKAKKIRYVAISQLGGVEIEN